MTPNKRFDTDPQQRRFAPLFRAGQSRRWASMASANFARYKLIGLIVLFTLAGCSKDESVKSMTEIKERDFHLSLPGDWHHAGFAQPGLWQYAAANGNEQVSVSIAE
ncbi:MAG: hypothetical protein L0219_14610, partial [Phycisphaerales bacterium]|nr:hypothetical protein [Phycisphaerales bacterium]